MARSTRGPARTNTYTPPITNTPQAVTINFTTNIICLVAPPVLNLQPTINWNGGRTSTADVLAVVSRTTGTTIATDTGIVTWARS